MNQWIGVSGFVVVREVTKLTGLSGIWAVLCSLVVGILLNFCLALIVGNDLLQGIAIGIVTALVSNVYHDIKTANQ